MARTLADTKIGLELYSDPDKIFSDQTIPNNTSVTSDAFPFGETLHGLELVAEVEDEVQIADTKSLSILILEDDESDGTFATSETLYTVSASGATETLTAGTELFRHVADTKRKMWYKVRITSTDTTETGSLNVNIASVKKD